MVYTKNLTNNATGTPVAFASARTVVYWVQVAAPDTNTNPIYVAGIDPTTKALAASFSNRIGMKVTAGTTLLMCPAISAIGYLDLSTLGFDVQTNGDKVSVTYSVR
jgi:hypothetical protein